MNRTSVPGELAKLIDRCMPVQAQALRVPPFWGRTGFDFLDETVTSRRGCIVGLVKTPMQKLKANANNTDSAMDEAARIFGNPDAVLAKFATAVETVA